MSKTTKRLWVLIPLAAAACVSLLFVALRTFAHRFEPEVRSRVVQYLEDRFDSSATLGSLQITMPKVSPMSLLLHGGRGTIVRVEGRSLSLRHHGGDDLPPLFAVESFAFNLDLGMLRTNQPRIPQVTLDGVTITLPPRAEQKAAVKKNFSGAQNVVIDSLDVTHARLIILPKRPDAKPLDFVIDTVHMVSAGAQQQLEYRATLTNPRPPGQIRSQGKFGPWNIDNPGDTPLEGDYDFANADLSVFSAIAGILHSSGHFNGTLSAVRAEGEATVPDFRLKTSGNRVPLKATFDVLVDGLNGNTILQPVHARLRNTEFQTSGGIIKHDKTARRAINLDVIMPNGHIEDLLLLAAKGKPFMSGLIRMNAKISVPPVGGSVKEKLFLAGTFNIARGEFLKTGVQSKVDELSRRGQGRPGDQDIDRVFSSMTGTFRLEDQVLTFTRLSFAVPGANVGLQGDYRMAEDVVDFHGDLKLEAKVSQTLQGWKHWLAKPFDPLFSKNGAGTYLKFQVEGNAQKPEFGLDHGKRSLPNPPAK